MSEAPEFVPLTAEELQEFFTEYEILSFIAAGGMGSVYLARDYTSKKKVAIKVLPRELSDDEEFSSQFRAEAKVMSKLNHPNLIGFHYLNKVADMFYIVMELVDGKSLHHSAYGEAIDQYTALKLVMGLASGVEHAHQAGILHRDIKPANILLDQNAFPKLGDFGLARPVEESEEGKVIYGTPGYTAPEVIDNPGAIDERSDIYSVGAILYELLTGHLPKEKYVPPSKLLAVEPVFDRVVQKALATEPGMRYSSMGAFLEDLNAIKNGFDESNPPEPEPTAPTPVEEVKIKKLTPSVTSLHPERETVQRYTKTKKSPFLWVIIAFALIAVVAGGVFFLK